MSSPTEDDSGRIDEIPDFAMEVERDLNPELLRGKDLGEVFVIKSMMRTEKALRWVLPKVVRANNRSVDATRKVNIAQEHINNIDVVVKGIADRQEAPRRRLRELVWTAIVGAASAIGTLAVSGFWGGRQ